MPSIDQARSWYDEEDPVHGFGHVLRVLRMAEHIGSQLGAQLDILRAAALLHDAASAHPADPEGRVQHEQHSAQFARQVLEVEGWDQEQIHAVQHCIRAHRYRGTEQPQSLEARILFDADKLDVLGAYGIARTIGFALQAGQPVYAPPSEHFLATGEEDQGEPHCDIFADGCRRFQHRRSPKNASNSWIVFSMRWPRKRLARSDNLQRLIPI
jgi:uncharacterized protein